MLSTSALLALASEWAPPGFLLGALDYLSPERMLVLVEGSLLSGVDSALSCPLLYSQRVNGAVCEHGLPAGLGAGAGKAV